MKKILLADDHALVREGIKMILEGLPEKIEVDEAYDGNSCMERIKIKEYHLVMLDVNMPETDSFSLVSNILAMKPGINILMCSMNPEEIYARKYLQLGAKGYLSKAADRDQIHHAVTKVLAGKIYMSPSLTQWMARAAINNTPANPFDHLSAREMEIARLLIKGASVANISNSLNVHTSTVGTHKARIMQKLQCKNVIELNELAKLHNLI
jgi:two-component system, NarL family, invasion response regulator UvrY